MTVYLVKFVNKPYREQRYISQYLEPLHNFLIDLHHSHFHAKDWGVSFSQNIHENPKYPEYVFI